ncbi:hypothetical protein BT69DRAFT_880915 [Atractiella rhizophila]|nr:hypothetical protein BT69DRAFT_880915 [Atractiella rhizophila]
MTLEIESLTAHSAYHPPTTIAEPSTDRTLSRFRKRWRIRPQSSAGQLGLNVVFWGQDETGNAQGIPGNVPPAPDSWSTEVIREYPLKPVNENAHYLQAGRAAQLQQQQHQQQMAQQQQQQQQQMVQQQQQQQQQLPQSQHPTTQQVLSNLNLSGGSIANYPAMLAQQLQSQQAQAQMGHNPLSNVQPSMVSAFLKHQHQQQQQQQQLSHPSLTGQGHPSNPIPSLAGTLNPQQLAVLAQQYQNRPPQTPQFGHPHQHPHALPHQQHQHSLPPQLQVASPHPSLQQVPATPRQQLALQPNMSSMSSMSSLSSMPQAQAQAMQQQMKMNFLQQQLRQQQQQQQQQQHQLQLQHQQQQQQQQLPMPPPQLSGPQMSLPLLPSAAQNIQQTAAPHALTHAHAQPHAPQRDQQAAREGHPMATMLNMNLGGAAGMGMGMNLAALEEWHFDPMEGAFGKELAAKRLTMNMALLEKILGPEHLSMAERDINCRTSCSVCFLSMRMWAMIGWIGRERRRGRKVG